MFRVIRDLQTNNGRDSVAKNIMYEVEAFRLKKGKKFLRRSSKEKLYKNQWRACAYNIGKKQCLPYQND